MKVVVVDYGMGNLHSVLKSVQAAQKLAGVRAEIELTDAPEKVFAADKIIFPGQGAMPDCMRYLDAAGLREAVLRAARTKPLFGVCVGEQMLFERSEEGDTEGLGVLGGQVTRFRRDAMRAPDGAALKVPHMGWNRVVQARAHPIWSGVPDGAYFYFVHSFALPVGEDTAAETSVQNVTFSSIVAKGNIIGFQFHPERSGPLGLRLLQTTIQLLEGKGGA